MWSCALYKMKNHSYLKSFNTDRLKLFWLKHSTGVRTDVVCSLLILWPCYYILYILLVLSTTVQNNLTSSDERLLIVWIFWNMHRISVMIYRLLLHVILCKCSKMFVLYLFTFFTFQWNELIGFRVFDFVGNLECIVTRFW